MVVAKVSKILIENAVKVSGEISFPHGLFLESGHFVEWSVEWTSLGMDHFSNRTSF